MEQFIDILNNKLLLKNSRWTHIITQHPEVKSYKKNILKILKDPDLIKRSLRDKDTFLYYRYYKNIYGGKYLVVVARMEYNPIILTYFITDRIKKGDVIWERS